MLYNELTLDHERRLFERFDVKSPAYAAVGPEFERIGRIINISRSGLAFSYIKHQDNLLTKRETRIQLSDSRGTFCVVPFITISDTGADIVDPYSSVELRYHRGRFGKLSMRQLDALVDFLKSKTLFNVVAI